MPGMNRLPHNLYTPAQVRELDRRAIEDHGIPGGVLMARAGRSAWQHLRQRFPAVHRLLVLCGGGNNGGDGYVVARLAAEAGLTVELCPMADPQQLDGHAREAADAALAVVPPIATPWTAIGEADAVVDAMLGTGIDRPVTGAMAAVIDALNAQHAPVMSIDVPSGLNARTGRVMGTAVRAATTPTFIGLKQGLFTGEAADFVGELAFDALQVPASVHDGIEPSSMRLSESALADGLRPRARTSHKGDFGHVRVIGGDHGMGGAVRMAGEAAARAGAGRVSIATRPAHVAAVLAARPELMVDGVDDATGLGAMLASTDTLAVGPGLGQSVWGAALFEHTLGHTGPMVLDADALNGLAGRGMRRDDWILTPHPGEAARLLDTTTEAIVDDRFAAAHAIVGRYGGIVVLKGAGTLIADDRRCVICTEGNPGMASGGMGDVLTGVIAGLRAQGLDAFDAACLGVQAHARSADRGACEGERGLLAVDLIDRLRAVINP